MAARGVLDLARLDGLICARKLCLHDKKVLLRSIDVLHDFYVPQIRAKMDLVPGMETYFWFTPTKAGQFEILCVAYCGLGHPEMRGMLFVESEADYKNWLSAQQTFAQIRAQTRGSRAAAVSPSPASLSR